MSDMHYDAVIVGSGFGGSVMAYRLAEAGLQVCLLERGKAYPPGSFPRSPWRMKSNFWDPSNGLYGMYNVWSFQNMSGIVSSALGGGSLIYSNVELRKEEKWFVKEDLAHGGYEYWPVTRSDLEPHYDRAEKMLHVQCYPFDQAPYNTTRRTIAFKEAAEQLNVDWFLPNVAVTFGNEGETPVPAAPIHEPYPNLHGPNAIRATCRMCGECNLGCNYGSKNSLDYTYLTEAKRQGAEIKTLCEVRSFKPSNGGYAISYVEHDLERAGQPLDTHNPAVLPLQTITADRLILSAGTFGSTYLLLKNRMAFPHLSPQLGHHFSGNGDFVSISLCSREKTGNGRVPRIIDGSYGPAISASLLIPDALDGGDGRGFYIQDVGYPDFVNWMLTIAEAPGNLGEVLGVVKDLLLKWIGGKRETDIGGYISRLFGKTELSESVFAMGGMGRDIPTGTMSLQEEKRLELDWPEQQSADYYKHVRQKMIDISNALGAEFVDNPLWYLNTVATVHPLGGCSMGRDESEGVVNSYGEVFNYPGLYVADGSVMPGPVGANPSLTIAALADRFADHIIDKKG